MNAGTLENHKHIRTASPKNDASPNSTAAWYTPPSLSEKTEAKAAVNKDKFQNMLAWDFKKITHKGRRGSTGEIVRIFVHFASLMYPCHLKHAELAETPSEVTKGRVVVRGDNVKIDYRYKGAFAEQGALASQAAAAATFLDTMSRRPSMTGEANDAVSAYTQVHMSEAHRLLRPPEKECPQVWIRLPPFRRPQRWDAIQEPVVLLGRTAYGHSLAGVLCERRMGEEHFETQMEKGTYLGMPLRPSKNINHPCA